MVTLWVRGDLAVCSHHDPYRYTTVLLCHLVEALLLGVGLVACHDTPSDSTNGCLPTVVFRKALQDPLEHLIINWDVDAVSLM